MDSPIGAFEAKTQLSRLLREVEQGQRFTISVRGKPVADLVPHQNEPSNAATAAAVQALQAFPKVRGLRDDDVADFVSEGRR